MNDAPLAPRLDVARLPVTADEPRRLAIDPSPTSTGYALVADGRIEHGTRRWKAKAIEQVPEAWWWGRALLLYRQWLSYVLVDREVQELWIELPGISSKHFDMRGSGRVVSLYCFAEAICDELCRQGHRIGFNGDRGRPSIYKHAVGDGRAKERELMATVRSWGYEPVSIDAAVALALLDLARSSRTG